MKPLLVALLFAFTATAAQADVPHLKLGLADVIEATYRQSPELKSAAAAAEAAEATAQAQRGRLAPQIAFEGSAQRLTDVPTLTLPGGSRVSLSDHESYSFGPAARYTLFNGGANLSDWKAAQAQARSRRLQEGLVRRQRTLAARLAYFQTQWAAENVRLLLESYKVAADQHRDIRERHAAGTATRIDLLSAHQQTLIRRRELLSARAELAVALREVTRLSGFGADMDLSLPLDDKNDVTLPSLIEPPTVLLEVAAVEPTLRGFSPVPGAAFDPRQPGIAYLSELADAARLAAKSLQAARWPELTLLAKTSLDYPNGPVREQVHQNTFGARISVPLFTGGGLHYNVRAKDRLRQAAEFDRDAAARDLSAQWQKARDRALVLRAQRSLFETGIPEAQELARLQYESYRAGRARYLDVEDANLKVLQIKTAAVKTDVDMLVQLATLDSLSVKTKE